MTPPGARPRFHAFDALRASMMLLGLVLHVATSYMTSISIKSWPSKDHNTSPWADLLVYGIHTFRMPVFFVMAGFFTALLKERYGVGGMLKNRAIRILVPLVIFWTLLTPLTYAAWAFAYGQGLGHRGWEYARLFLTTGKLWGPYLLYFWFLYLLLWFYLVAAVLGRLISSAPAAWKKRASATFNNLMNLPGRAFILAPPTAALLYFQGGILSPVDLIPRPVPMLTYLSFFGFGWVLYLHRNALDSVKRGAWLSGGFALVLFLVSSKAAGQITAGRSGALLLVASLNAVIAWLCVFGLSGLALQYLDRPIPAARYLTDAAYWCYLVHLPIALWLSGLLAPYDLPAALKIALVLLMLIPLVLLTYQLLVRPTALGVLLGGKRRGAALDAPVVEGAQ